MTFRVLVIGDSHTRCLSQALAGRNDADCFEICWLKNPKRNGSRGDTTEEEARTKIANLAPDDVLAISLLGTFHNVAGLLQHPDPFDFIEPGNESVAPDARLIPYSTLRDLFISHLRSGKRVREIAASSPCRTVHLSTPPVKGDNDYIKEHAANYRGTAVAEAGVTPAPLRAKLWRLEASCLAENCNEWGIEFVEAPAESLTDDGYLKPEFYAPDATHANAGYGSLVLNQLTIYA